jgi:hypothetical protein
MVFSFGRFNAGPANLVGFSLQRILIWARQLLTSMRASIQVSYPNFLLGLYGVFLKPARVCYATNMISLDAFIDELEKIAVKIPFIHGTSGRWPILLPGIGKPILSNDPNPRAVYTATKNRRQLRHVEQFAHSAVRRRGGEPTIIYGKMDTKKGWRPRLLTEWGKKNIGTIEDANHLLDELETASEPRRGEIWRTLQRGVGSWRNQDLRASLRPTKYKTIPSPSVKAKVA